MKKVISILIAVTMLLTSAVGVSAATKPERVETVKLTQTSDTSFRVTWSGNAKRYQVQIIKPQKGWNKYKKVKKTVRNRKIYTKANKYKVKANGKKYQVYKYDFIRVSKYTNGKSKLFTRMDKYKTYKVRVRGINGDKKGVFSLTKSITLRPSFKISTSEIDMHPTLEKIVKVQVPNRYATLKVESSNPEVAEAIYDKKTKGFTRSFIVRGVSNGYAKIKVQFGKATKNILVYVKDNATDTQTGPSEPQNSSGNE